MTLEKKKDNKKAKERNSNNLETVDPVKNKKIKHRKTLFLISSLVIILLTVIVVLIKSGVINLTRVSDSELDRVCDDKTIATYNTTKNRAILDGTWPQELEKISSQISLSDGYEEDMDCLYILAQNHMEKREWSLAHHYILKMKAAADQLNSTGLSEELTDLTPKQMEDYLNYMFLMDSGASTNDTN